MISSYGDALLELKLAFNAMVGQRLGSWRPADTNPYGWAGRASPAPSQILGSSSPMQFHHTHEQEDWLGRLPPPHPLPWLSPHRDDRGLGGVAAPSSFLHL